MSIRSPYPVLATGLSTGSEKFDPKTGTLAYTFKQEIPIPSYLLALASGDIAAAAIGPRSTVHTGPEELCKCKYELEGDTERFIKIAEGIVFPYTWTTYNVLILPPSFPYGGMEVSEQHDIPGGVWLTVWRGVESEYHFRDPDDHLRR